MFSVVIPLYNKGSLIKRSIDSVLSQTFQEFEIVVVDDGSKDDSSEYVKEYRDSRVKYYYKHNGGVSSARNYGIEIAEYDWILFLDADDELLPNALEKFCDLINNNRECKFFVGKNVWIKGNSRKKELAIDLEKKNVKDTCTLRPFLHLWAQKFYAAPRNMVVHKAILEKFGGFDTRMSFYEDFEFSLRLLQSGRVTYTSSAVAIYYQDGGLSSSRHPIEKEMAYYIPEIVQTQMPNLWYKALLYENIEMEKVWWTQCGDQEKVAFYQDMQKKYFSWIHKPLHWIRQKLIRLGII